MAYEASEFDSDNPHDEADAKPGFNLFALILLPLALVIYVAALPFFAFAWMLDWILPTHDKDPSRDAAEKGSLKLPRSSGRDLKHP